MVAVTDPRLGETVLDPAAGTGGFLVETYNHLAPQVKTVQQRRRLQEHSLFGCEAKPLPYLLCQMNLLLHGLDAPQIDPGNALRDKLTDIGEKDRVDVILTNPPFGGEEERGVQGNFPEDMQTSETALLFLQLIMRKLRRASRAGFPAARAAVVVPNGTLFGDGVCASWFVSPEYRTFRCLPGEVTPAYLSTLVSTEWFWRRLTQATRGVGARRERTRPEQFLDIELPMPDIEQQHEAEKLFSELQLPKRLHAEAGAELGALLPSILDRAFTGDQVRS